MKCTIPEISWHNKDPVLSIDIQSKNGEDFYRLASGGTDSHILIWHLTEQTSGIPSLECVSDLTRHQKAVNVVRFSPSGNILASGDDESVIILWKQKTDQDPIEFPEEQEIKNREQWLVFKILRGHLEDIYDLSWSADENNIISGSVDNTAIVWDIKKGRMKDILRDHKSFVQGVAWDPLGQYLATLSSDRVCRIFNVSNQKIVSRVGKLLVPGAKPEAKPVHLFHDDTLKSFFRRLCFSPCGNLLIAPAGVIEPQEPGQKVINTTLVFARNSLSRPIAYLPSYDQYSVAVRCCPKLFALRDTKEPPLINLPYRVVYAIATQSSVILYDTQHFCPFAFIANIHYTRLTDITWSSDGKILIVSSTDGYCSIITFSDNELGEPYERKKELESNKINSKEKKSNNEEPVKSSEDLKMECSEIKIVSPEKSSSKIFKGNKTDDKCKRKESNDLKSLNEVAVLKNCLGTSSSSNEVKQLESVIDETNDYCLVLEESMTDLAGSSRKENELNENLILNNAKILPPETMDKNKSNVNVGLSSVETKIEKNDKTDGLTKTLDSDSKKPEKKEIPKKQFEENDSACGNDADHKTPSKDPGKSATLNSPASSIGSSKNCTPPPNITPIEQRKPKRAQLITLSSPKSKKKL